MADFGTDFNIQSFNIDPSMLVEEVSTDEFYIGTSNRGDDPAKACWQIKYIWKDGSIWRFQFPDGNRAFNYIWNGRWGYTYKG